jgi:hypothetical protein
LATSSFSTVRGASWADHENANVVFTQGLAESEIEAVEPGLAGSVDEVAAPHTFSRDRTHRDDLAVALRAHLLAEQYAHRYRRGVVDVGGEHGLALVLPDFFVHTLYAEGHDGHVDVATGEGLVDHRGMGVRRECVEVDTLHRRCAGGLHLLDRSISRRVSGHGREDHAHRTLLEVLGGDGQSDLGAATEHQDGLRYAYGVDHECSCLVGSSGSTPGRARPRAGDETQASSRRRAMSEMNTPVGSILRRLAIHESICGYMAWKFCAEVRESLAV